MPMTLRPGSRITTAEGDDLGTIRQLVVDPSRSQVTHILVEKGVFFTDDRVVPTDAIDHLDDDVAVLKSGIDPTGLPRFDRRDYTPGDEATSARLDLAPAELYLWRHPIAHAASFPLYPAYPVAPSVRPSEGVADSSARKALAEGEIVGGRTSVVSVDGERVGTVDEVVVDREGRLSHLMVDLGLLTGDVILPAHWIEGIDAESVRLAVSDAALVSLETIT